jgi:hypothetical protein
MNQTARILSGIALGLVIGVVAQAEEKKIKQSDLPAAVRKTAAQQSAGATVTGYSQDNADGGMVYEMELLVDGHAKAIMISPDGVVVAMEEEIPWDSLPANVKTDLTAAAGKGKIGKVESMTKNGKVVGYEADVDTNGKKSEISVKPRG